MPKAQYIARGMEKEQYANSDVINIDNGSGTTFDTLILVPDQDIYIESARVFYTEATDTSGAASASVKIGTTVGGNDIVASTNLQVSKAIGATTNLVVADGLVLANELVAVRHTGIAATEAGQYKVEIRYRLLP